MKLLYTTCCILLIVGILPLPYGYYQFLRLAVCGTALYIAHIKYAQTKNLSIWACAIALLYNPVFIIYLSRSIWLPINIITAIYFGYFMYNDEHEK